ncbi:MAG: hypothetical protein DMD48_08095 [Gemmatimonadetes bacterium]|nr:MAG: hypothetical protein DMD48_08095 [Gemmatimonadota bacterium]
MGRRRDPIGRERRRARDRAPARSGHCAAGGGGARCVAALARTGRPAGEHCVRRGAAQLVPPGPRRPLFYLSVLAVGFVLGGLLQAFLRRFLPQGPAKEVFTWAVTPTIGPIHLDLLVMSITLGPIGLDVSLLAVVGVVIAYLVARSLF